MPREQVSSGRTSISLRTCGAAWNAHSRGVCERLEELSPTFSVTLHFCLGAPLINAAPAKRWSVIKKAGRQPTVSY